MGNDRARGRDLRWWTIRPRLFAVAIGIVGSLALAVAAVRFGRPSILGHPGLAGGQKVHLDMRALDEAVRAYAAYHAGKKPDTLARLLEADEHGHRPLNAARTPRDPWGREYGYDPCGGEGEMDLWTLGRDGRPGGVGDDQDIHLVDVLRARR